MNVRKAIIRYFINLKLVVLMYLTFIKTFTVNELYEGAYMGYCYDMY